MKHTYTEEEKEKLFKAIKEHGYKWNEETKTLEKLEQKKFNITTLKPFDKVLVRAHTGTIWRASLFSNIFNGSKYPFETMSGCFTYCIPYKNNEHLLGTRDDCDEYYKTWEK